MKASFPTIVRIIRSRTQLGLIRAKLFGIDASEKNKIGFRVPFDEWIQNKLELRKFCIEKLSKTNQFEELNHKKIEELKQKLEKNERLDNSEVRIIWLLTNYLLWRQSNDENI